MRLAEVKQRGVAVIVVLMMMLLIIGFTAGAGLLTKQNYTNSSHNEKVFQARYAIRAASATALEKLTRDPTWAPTQLAPFSDTLDSVGDVGFEIWLEGANLASSTPLTTPSGQTLHKGQVALHVTPIVGGEPMANAFAGAENLIVFVRPAVVFNHALQALNPGHPLDLPVAGSTIMSYDSTVAPPPAVPAAAVSPLNTSATISSLNIINCFGTAVEGSAEVPTGGKVNVTSGSISGGITRVDTMDVQPTFDAPLGSRKATLPPTRDGTGFLAPGVYTDINIPVGDTLRLQYGATYVVWDEITLGANSRIILQGDITAGPVQVYGHGLYLGDNVRVNMPPVPTEAPRPEMFQFYGVPMFGCTQSGVALGTNVEMALLASLPGGFFEGGLNSKLYGAVQAQNFYLDNGLQIYYDLVLRGKEQPAVANWTLVSESN